jgi:transcriptional regulator with XRE-family HTH domain
MPSRQLWIWEEDECLALVEAMAEYNAARSRAERITQCHIAKELGVASSTVNTYFRGKKALSTELAQAVLKLTGIPVGRLSPRLADDIRLKHAPQKI